MAHMTCQGCGKPLPEATARRRFCGPACRARYWRNHREEVVREALATARLALERAQKAMGSGGDGR